VHEAQSAVVVGVRYYFIELVIVSALAQLKDDVIGAHFADEVADQHGVVGDFQLERCVRFLRRVIQNVVHNSNCKYFLREVL